MPRCAIIPVSRFRILRVQGIIWAIVIGFGFQTKNYETRFFGPCLYHRISTQLRGQAG